MKFLNSIKEKISIAKEINGELVRTLKAYKESCEECENPDDAGFLAMEKLWGKVVE